MKKIFAIALTLCLMVSALCVMTFTASAEEPTVPAEPAAGVVMRVSALKNGDSVYYPEKYDFTSFEEGWNAATELADNSDVMKANDLDRVVVELYANWKANTKGEFGDSDGLGFQWSTIYVPGKARMTINMNGHTIDRGLGENNELDGEVICVEKKANLIINDGTITGGNSDNGAGGIHVEDGAHITLNNVKVDGNTVDDDDGGAIALYNGATLVMNGGSISNNISHSFTGCYGTGVYVYGSTATFENVTFQNNQNTYHPENGTVIYADNYSTVKMNKCQVIDNGTYSESQTKGSISIIEITGTSRAEITETTFRGNGYAATNCTGLNTLITVGFHSYLYLDNCTFNANSVMYLLEANSEDMDVVNSSFLNNAANVFYGGPESNITFTKCTFNNNPASQWTDYYSFDFLVYREKTAFIDCSFGNSTFNDRDKATFTKTNTDIKDPNESGDKLSSPSKNDINRLSSIFGEGSPAMIIAILALFASVASICLTIVYNKDKMVRVVANDTEENEDGETDDAKEE